MKLFFFDYDGTLLVPGNKAMSERNRKALTALKDAGHRIVLCTGRGYGHVAKELWDLGFDAYATACGALIIKDGKPVHEDRLPHELVMASMKIIWDKRLDGAVEGSERVKFYHHFEKDHGIYPEVYSYSEYEERFSAMPVHKFTLYKVPMDPDVRDFFLENGMEIINNNNVYYEIIRKGNDKGKAVRDCLDLFGVARKDSYCFGDSMNDRLMLKEAGHSIVVGSAPDDVKAMADEVVPPVEEDGVACWIEDFLKESLN